MLRDEKLKKLSDFLDTKSAPELSVFLEKLSGIFDIDELVSCLEDVSGDFVLEHYTKIKMMAVLRKALPFIFDMSKLISYWDFELDDAKKMIEERTTVVLGGISDIDVLISYRQQAYGRYALVNLIEQRVVVVLKKQLPRIFDIENLFLIEMIFRGTLS